MQGSMLVGELSTSKFLPLPRKKGALKEAEIRKRYLRIWRSFFSGKPMPTVGEQNREKKRGGGEGHPATSPHPTKNWLAKRRPGNSGRKNPDKRLVIEVPKTSCAIPSPFRKGEKEHHVDAFSKVPISRGGTIKRKRGSGGGGIGDYPSNRWDQCRPRGWKLLREEKVSGKKGSQYGHGGG